ncbi:AAA family ATPase [Marinobacterium sediminicola]|uniref:Exonuclease SbcC n=1 Tax=Marinobacterium sediminicola TaxID=518898 RepID=A0ABY1RWA4_9GAMM|nr:AAA family ATPase [Marinobacterium sediminicola]ULG70379.1 AAA family ATPase [Marinobacterium sediminicola]SMR69565.1 exonuclease SbcC [Marinobacterium sediminicola]
MRILQIRFKNLNSLSGEWQIDLTEPAYTADGIFAITGPTGAGKSTLLDAICLALYGRTPRQSRVNASQNEVMSRQTGECFAEVVFETPQGRWCCHWSQHRSRKRPDGSLQQPRHEVSEADTGKVLVTRLKDVADTIERLTGMDFDRFTRSMLLAQGGFAAFLQADPDERAPILEQITGTSIYSDISIAVHRRKGEEKQKLEQLKAAQLGLQLLDDDEEATLSRELAALDEQVREQQQQVEHQQSLVNWRLQLDREHEQLKRLQQDQERLDQDWQAFTPQQQVLEQALKAEALRPDFAPLCQRRRDLAQAQEGMSRLQAQLPELEKSTHQAGVQLDRAVQHRQQAEEELERQQPLLRQLREQDYAIGLKQKELQQMRAQLPADVLQGPAPDPDLLVTAIQQTESELKVLLGNDNRDELKQQQEEIRTRGESLGELRGLVRQSDELTQEHQALVAGLAEQDRQQQLGQEQLLQVRKEIETLLREQQDLQKLQRLADRIADLEQQRHELEAGKPCPLCGSTEHPWRSQHPPELSEEKARLHTLESRLATRQSELQQLEIGQARLLAQIGSQRQQTERLLQKLQALESPIQQCLQPLGWQTCPSREVIEQAYRDTGEHWKQLKQRLDRIDALEVEQKRQQQEQQRQQQRLAVDGVEAELAELRQQRAALSPEPDTDALEKRLQASVVQARTVQEQAQAEAHRCEQMLNQRRLQISDSEASMRRLQDETEQMQSAFMQALSQSQFKDEAQLQAALKPAEQLQQLQRQAEMLKSRGAELKALRDRCEQAVTVLQQQALSNEPIEHLEDALQQLKAHQAQLLQQRGSLQQQLSRNESLKQQFGEQQRAIDAQQRELSRWEQLHELIGSADGKKFRNFAQGLTFELMVGHANRQLQKMSDRYLLVRDAEQPLELNVIDNYQAGEIRSTKNLSGGESFLISLALALGLSGMASRNVRVDSLFLDEGFGTLDEEALETALDTLSGLQQEGKLIGVISHVQALKDRISTRIEVSPVSGGRSRITGPGCRRLD